MTKKINIILTKDYVHIGKKGTIHKVSHGYAVNYLIPSKLAEIATPKKLKHYEMFANIITKKNEEYKIEIQKLENLLEKINKISIYKKRGEKYQYFGNINEKNIVYLVQLYTGKTLNKKQIIIPTMKEIGVHNIQINIESNTQCKIKLHILPENI